jgi:hypothetical protein
METFPGTTNQGTPFHGEPFVFPCFGNVGPPYIATLSLPGFTIGLPVWFFSTLVIPNSLGASNAIPPPQEHQPHVDPFPSSPLCLLPFLLLRLVKVLMLVTRRLRRRRKGRTRRRKISKGEINQPLIIMLGVLMILTSLPNTSQAQIPLQDL